MSRRCLWTVLIGLVVPVTLSTSGSICLAGGWLQEPGEAYVRVSSGWLSTRERFDPDGNRVRADFAGGGFRDPRFEDLNATLYAEVGVHADWNLVAGVTWKHIRALQPSAEFTTYGFGDLQLGAKRNVWRGPSTAVAVLGVLSVPTGYDAEEYLALGSDVTEASLFGSAGLSTGGIWMNLEAGYRIRGGGFGSQILTAFGGGTSLRPWMAVRGEVRSAVARGGSRIGNGTVTDNFDPSAVDPTTIDLAATVALQITPGLALEGEVRGPVYGENTLTGARWSLALATSPAWRWRPRSDP